METETRRKGPRSPSEDSDDMRRRKKYDRSPSPRRRYRRSRSRSTSRDRSSRRKSSRDREHDWKAMQPTNKAANPPNSTVYPPQVLNQYNAAQRTAPPPNTSQPPPPMQYTQGYGNYNYNYSQSYADYAGYQQAAGYRNVSSLLQYYITICIPLLKQTRVLKNSSIIAKLNKLISSQSQLLRLVYSSIVFHLNLQ
ncbi:hypothetical protein TSAR_008631 [Trichomalopsis sarcophagae]|uniref:Uncharacterized protein n=1 Tax=Trichomalopsis sarcophagae TaxID=543379 RepID=A0A232EI89_9HYME|nr:hypothetical protein TSAR_008631 [Trichomalopsis sarcophagae]